MVIRDVDTNEVFTFENKDILKGLSVLDTADMLIGHNIIDYDLSVLDKLYNWSPSKDVVIRDTIVMAKLAFQDIRTFDFSHKPPDLEVKQYGSQSLKAWGQRLGNYKGDFDGGDWQTYSPEMLTYCIQDTDTTKTLFEYLQKQPISEQSLELETAIQFTAARMEKNGFTFDEENAAKLYADLASQRETIRQELTKVFPTRKIPRISEKTGRALKTQVIEFNPGSRDRIAYWLKKKYDWKPTHFTPGGKPEINEEILESLTEYPECVELAKYFMLDKRIGMLSEGTNGWMKLVWNGRLHGRLNTNGAATGRCTHSNPNMAQVPSVRKPYGKEIRQLFTVPKGYKLVGTDLSGIELRCLAHYLAAYDKGEYANEIMHGDVHTRTQEAAGLPTRDAAKTFTYALLYGAGDAKIGSIVGGGSKEGKSMKQKFFTSLPAFGTLTEKVKKAAERGFIIALDGRRLPVRSGHGAINSLLQGAAAIIAKKWVVLTEQNCEKEGLVNGVDFWISAFVHDEIQITVKEQFADLVSKISVDSALQAGQELSVRIPVGAESKIGNNWMDTH
jgi:DNA polymerase I-like protein with 3'-5' exonuclease and polymerase domains